MKNNTHISVLPVPSAHPMAQRISATVPQAPPAGGPPAKFWPPLKGKVPPPEMAIWWLCKKSMEIWWKYSGYVKETYWVNWKWWLNNTKTYFIVSLGTKWDLPKWKCTGLQCGYYGICDMHNKQYGCYEDLGY